VEAVRADSSGEGPFGISGRQKRQTRAGAQRGCGKATPKLPLRQRRTGARDGVLREEDPREPKPENRAEGNRSQNQSADSDEVGSGHERVCEREPEGRKACVVQSPPASLADPFP
jgi:hypothetical protein